MFFNGEKKTADSAYWLAELKHYEEKIARLTETLEKRSEEFVTAEEALIKLIDENPSGDSHFPTSVDSSKATNERKHIDTLRHLNDEIKMTRQGLQEAEKQEQLTGTVLTRITSFISKNDEEWEPHLDRLRVAVECFQSAWIGSEKHNKKLKERLKMVLDENYVKDSLSGSRDDQLQFSTTEKKMAPLFVEVNRMVRYLLECIAVSTVSLKRKRELCLLNREHLEKEHETANMQFKGYKNVLKDVRRALESVEQALHSLRMTNSNKEKSRDELEKELLVLGTTPNSMEYVTAMVEALAREKTELMVLNQASEEAGKISQKVLGVEKEALESAKAQTIALGGTQNTLNKMQESILVLEKEKIELQERIETSHEMKRKHHCEVESQKKVLKEIKKEIEEIEETKKLFVAEAQPFYILLDETKKQMEILISQLESKTSRKEMLYDEKQMVEDNIKKLKSECERSRTDFIEMHRGILTLKQEKDEVSRYLEYITSLMSDSVVSALSMPFTHQDDMSKKHGEETLHEMITEKNKTLVEKARREYRQSLTVRESLISSRMGPNKPHNGFDSDKYNIQYSLSSSMKQQPPYTTNSVTSAAVTSASAHYSSDAIPKESRETSVFFAKEEHPFSTTSRIIKRSPEEHSFTFPNTSVIHVSNTKSGSSPVRRIEGSSILKQENTMILSSEPQFSWNRDENQETSSTIASINRRLHDILNLVSFFAVMEKDTAEDVRQYLARDEHEAKVQFRASLEGRTSDELMALLKIRKDSDIDDKCLDDGTTNSSCYQRKDATLQSKKLSRTQHENDVESTVMGTEKVVEICTVGASHDELLSEMSENDRFRKNQEEHSSVWKAVYSGEIVTKEELEEVRREMIMHERVVKALETDNINLHKERRALRAKLNEMENKAVNVEAKYSILASGQSPNHGSVRQAPSVTMMSWQGEQQLTQDEVSMELERQRTVVRELQLELELLRREKKDIETRLASLDAKKFEEMELELRNLRVDLKRKETDHNETVKDMARKIAWYVEHQEFNHSQEELLKEQQDIIRRLRTRLHEVGALDSEGKKMRVSKDTHVRNLTKRIVELEEALNSKYPNSIAQLIRSCQPSVQDSKLFKQLNLKIKELENALAEKDRCAEAAVTRLRVETDRMRIQYQERIEKLEEELKLRFLHAQTRRVRELEKQLSEARQALREKEREKTPPVSVELVASCNDDHLREKQIESSSPLEEVKKPAAAKGVGVINSVDETNLQLQEENKVLRSELFRVTRETTKNTPIIPSSSSQLHLQSQLPQDAGTGVSSYHLISSMQAQINTLIAEQTIYKRLLMESQESLRDAHTRWDERLLTARQEYQLQVQRIRQEHNDEIARIQEHHQREVHSIVEQNRSAEEASRVCEKLLQSSSNDPRQSHTFLQSVAERLVYLERRQERKEREFAYEIAEVKRVADFELSLMKQKAEMMIEQKNHQIHEFRLQLDHLLSSLALLQTYA